MPFLRHFKALVSFGYDTAVAEDVSQNTFYFRVPALERAADTLDDITNALVAFYNTIDGYLSENVSSPARIRIYDHTEAPPRTPLTDDTFVIVPGAAPNLPNEVAICVSYAGQVVSGVNRRRNRGRIYIGPLTNAVLTDSDGDTRVVNAVCVDIANAAKANLMNLAVPLGGAAVEWSVFSRSNALGLPVGVSPPAAEPDYTEAQLELGYREIVTVYVDNGFDTQRRRGLTASARFSPTV